MTITDPEMSQPRRQEFRETHPRRPWGTELPVSLPECPSRLLPPPEKQNYRVGVSFLSQAQCGPTRNYIFLTKSNPQIACRLHWSVSRITAAGPVNTGHTLPHSCCPHLGSPRSARIRALPQFPHIDNYVLLQVWGSILVRS